MATPNTTSLERWTNRGVVALPPPGDHQLSDVGVSFIVSTPHPCLHSRTERTVWAGNDRTQRAMQLGSDWYVPVGVHGPPGTGSGGIHWYRAAGDNMAHLSQVSWLFTDHSPAEDPDGEMSCPDVFELGGCVRQYTTQLASSL
jgi:hypothetical protein